MVHNRALSILNLIQTPTNLSADAFVLFLFLFDHNFNSEWHQRFVFFLFRIILAVFIFHFKKLQRKWCKSAFSSSSLSSERQTDCSSSERKSFGVRSLSENDTIDFTLNEDGNDSFLQLALDQIEMKETNFHSSDWIENFAPRKRDELAIHAKKLAELDDWFRSISTWKTKKLPPPLLLLNGPSGAGKTAALRIISKDFGYIVKEWITPADIEYVRNDETAFGENQVQQFWEFLGDSSRYKSIFDSSGKSLLLVEDFPHAFIREPEKMNEVLERYRFRGKAPLVFIVADTKSRSNNINHILFPDIVRAQFGISTISFNAVADTVIKKGIARVCEIMKQPAFKEYYDEPSKELIENIVFSSQGDLRNAIINLHFASQKSNTIYTVYDLVNSIIILSDAIRLPTQPNAQENGNARKKTKTSKKGKFKHLGCDENVSVVHALGRVMNPKCKTNVIQFDGMKFNFLDFRQRSGRRKRE